MVKAFKRPEIRDQWALWLAYMVAEERVISSLLTSDSRLENLAVGWGE
jgi:hypothetical protein